MSCAPTEGVEVDFIVRISKFLMLHLVLRFFGVQLTNKRMRLVKVCLILLLEEIRLTATSWYGTYPHYLQGFIHVRWCRISSINSISSPCQKTPPPFSMFRCSEKFPTSILAASAHPIKSLMACQSSRNSKAKTNLASLERANKAQQLLKSLSKSLVASPKDPHQIVCRIWQAKKFEINQKKGVESFSTNTSWASLVGFGQKSTKVIWSALRSLLGYTAKLTFEEQ